MDIKELNKTQLILLSLLITFVVSIATGIVTVSLMQQAPKSVPQTINNVIQRTIEKVTTVEVPIEKDTVNTTDSTKEIGSSSISSLGDGDALVSIYLAKNINSSNSELNNEDLKDRVSIGQGVIISDIGLILVNSNIIEVDISYVVSLNDIDYPISILKNFGNGFTVMKISNNQDSTENGNSTDTPTPENANNN